VRVFEKSPLRGRFEPKDVLLKSLQSGIFGNSIRSESGRSTVTVSSNASLVLHHSPLKVEFVVAGQPVMTLNERGLFNFEHYRTKDDDLARLAQTNAALPVEQSEGQEANGEAGEAPAITLPEGLWEESFSSHHDSKPHGPSSVGLDVTFVDARHVYGIPEHATHLALPVTKGPGVESDPYRLYNLDVFEYEVESPMALYGAVPLMLSHNSKMTAAFFWLNPSETWIDVSQLSSTNTETHWFSEAGNIDLFMFASADPAHIMSLYGQLTGTTPIPPQFTIAYHQCRWNYRDEEDVRQVDAGFDEHDIPYDVIWLDIEHTDAKKYFTWDPVHFPNPTEMQNKIDYKQRKMVTIVDPHIKRDGGYYVHQDATSNNHYVKNKDGHDYEGWCWPGSSSWVDYPNPSIRDWWAQNFQYDKYVGSTKNLYTWNDMNEPSVFNGPEVTMHKDAKHLCGEVEHRELHNMYGFYMQMATADGLVKRNADHAERPFVLTRSFFAGSQRHGAVWTGDNAAQWSHLQISLPMLMNLGLGGIAFSGADVGGFFGNPDGELSTRWYQAAAFQPFFRGHAHLDSKRREPWLFGEPYTSYIRTAIRRRYQLLPYWYTLFAESNRTGQPPMRPLWYHFPRDPATFANEDSFLVGRDLLVRPVLTQGATEVTVYLPGTSSQRWYEFDGWESYTGSASFSKAVTINDIPVFQRGGSIIPRKDRARRASYMMTNDPLTLQVALDSNEAAEGELYLDDGHTFGYLQGAYLRKRFTFDKQNSLQVSTIDGNLNSFQPQATVERVVVKGYPKQPSHVQLLIDGSSHNLEFSFDYPSKTLTIRKPDAPIAKDWQIKIQ
jgi:alpha 1,3-glucosidase